MGQYCRDIVFELLADRESHGLEEIRDAHPRWRTGLRMLVDWGWQFERNGDSLRLLPKPALSAPVESSRKAVDELIAMDPDPDPDAPPAPSAPPKARKKANKRRGGVESGERKGKQKHGRSRSGVVPRQGDRAGGLSREVREEGPSSEEAEEEGEAADGSASDEVDAADIHLDVAQGLSLGSSFVTETAAVIARKGSGKSYFSMVVAEEFLRSGLPFCTLDPTGAWWGLRCGSNGRVEDGFAVPVIGGEHNDLPFDLHARHGAAAALWLVERYPAQLVVDLSLLTPDQQHIFAYGFFSTIYMKNRRAFHIFVDEADEFAAQSPKSPMEEKCKNQVDRVVRRGRIRGLGTTLITQRSAVLNKNVLTQVGRLFVLKTKGPQDLKAIEGWITNHLEPEETTKVLKALPQLPRGVLFDIASTAAKPARHEVRRKLTWDSSRTPEVGEDVVVPPLREVDSGELSRFLEAHSVSEDEDSEGVGE